MVRISPKSIRQAKLESPLLSSLLKATRDLDNARLELKWIKEELPENVWIDAVKRRSKLEPLQYIIGSQPFGSLSIKCSKNVLIPRWETEEWSNRLFDLLLYKNRDLGKEISILDICTGTGCIPLLAFERLCHLESVDINIRGLDVSSDCIKLAKQNMKQVQHLFETNRQVSFLEEDVFKRSPSTINSTIDIITSNPPYIPISDYYKPPLLNGVDQSVRLYEPKLALIGHLEFYRAIVKNYVLQSNCQAFVFEIGYLSQAEIVCSILKLNDHGWSCGVTYDSNSQLRTVVGWKATGKFGFLSQLCDKMLNI